MQTAKLTEQRCDAITEGVVCTGSCCYRMNDSVGLLKRPDIKDGPREKLKSPSTAWSVIINAFAVISLISAYIAGQIYNKVDYEQILKEKLPHSLIERQSNNPLTFIAKDKDNKVQGHIRISEQQGYGGPLIVGAFVDNDARIKEVIVLSNKETPAFYRRLQSSGFFRQFIGKEATDNFVVGADIDTVSGATVSTVAFSKAIREGSHGLAVDSFGLVPETQEEQWNLGTRELVLLAILTLATVAVFLGKKSIRYVSLGISLFFVGFYYNGCLSVSHFSALMKGFLPSIKEHLFWWIHVLCPLAIALIFKKNIYCRAVCPFHALQIILSKTSGLKLQLPRALSKIAYKTPKIFLYLSLMIIFLSANPTLASYEPFAMVFSLEGVGMQWYILPAVILGAFFISDFFCRLFCPVGCTITYLIRFRQKIDKIVLRSKKQQPAEHKTQLKTKNDFLTHKKQKITTSKIFASAIFVIAAVLILAFFGQAVLTIWFAGGNI